MFSNRSLDELQRTGYQPPPISLPQVALPGPERRRAVRVCGIGKPDKYLPDGTRTTAALLPNRGSTLAGQPSLQQARPFRPRLPSEDLLIGLSTYEIPLAFQLSNTGTRISVQIGTWLSQDASPGDVAENLTITKAALRASYLSVDLEDAGPAYRDWRYGGIVLGLPALPASEADIGGLPLDRLIRAMRGMPWACTIVAQPVAEAEVRAIRNEITNEIRVISNAITTRGPSPLEQYYAWLLQHRADFLQDAQATGAWRVGVYLAGTEQSFYALATVWRAMFSGPDSQVEPLRVYELEHAVTCAQAWALPDPGRGRHDEGAGYRHRFAHQTLLNSAQLAAYVHFPSQETAGFRVDTVPMFDSSPQPAGAGAIRLGRVIEARDYAQSAARLQASGDDFDIGRDLLTRHAFVTGLTGEGKTTTVQRLLTEAWRDGTPFLVIEPAKHEYRQLISDPGAGPALRVFTPGLETGVPLRVNPFEVPAGIPVSVHLDLLRSAFNASFGMWTPLPQVLEVCLHEVYEDRGWDLTTGTNFRLDGGDDRAPSFPRMTDLLAKVKPVVTALGYDSKVTDDMMAALTTRLRGLASGPKGRIFDVQNSVPMEFILSAPTVIELENIGDDDDKAFVMSILLVRLVEFWRSRAKADGRLGEKLRHLLVIEEAHRLLANTARQRDETQSDPRGRAVETFADMLAEIRAYGQGIVIVDQSAAKLIPDVIRNSNLKIAHRVVDGSDRETIAKSTVMNDRQQRALATLPRGSAAVFLSGEDAPLHVLVTPSAPPPASQEAVTSDLVRSRSLAQIPQGVLRPEPGGCELDCGVSLSACAAAARALGDAGVRSAVARCYATAELIGGGLQQPWEYAERSARYFLPPQVDHGQFRRSFAAHAALWICRRRGDQRGWRYADVDRDADEVREIFAGLSLDRAPAATEPLSARRDRPAPRPGPGPYPYCSMILPLTGGFPCSCRHAIGDLLADGSYDTEWTANSSTTKRARLCLSIGGEAIYSKPMIDKASTFPLCAAQQLNHRTRKSHPVSTDIIALFNEIHAVTSSAREGAVS